MKILLTYKSQIFSIDLENEDRLVVLFDFIREVTPLNVATCRMIYKGKQLSPFACARDVIEDNGKVLLMGSTQAAVEYIKQAKADPLVKGFEALERDDKIRRKRTKMLQKTAWGTSQHKEFRFCSIKAEFKYTTPTPFEAEALLTKLASDPGIIKIMTERRFVVGTLTEMSPLEAQERMRQEGKDGDLLGFNENFGARIVLRIRTDDVKGFRRYYDLINTLIHELTHNVYGPHDDKFWALFRELKKNYDTFHDGYSRHGKTTGDAGIFSGFADSSDSDEGVAILGGTVITDREIAREVAAQRAIERSKIQREFEDNSLVCEKRPREEEEEPSLPSKELANILPDDAINPLPMDEPSLPSKELGNILNDDAINPLPMDLDNPVESDASSLPKITQDAIEVDADETPISLPDGMDTSGLDWVRSFQGEVRRLPAGSDALRTLRALVRNLKNHPEDPKFRSVKRSGHRIQALVQVGGAKCLELLGFECVDEQFVMHPGRIDVGKFYIAHEILE